VTGGERRERSGVDDDAASGEVSFDVVGLEMSEVGERVVSRGPAPIEFRQAGEVGGEGAEPGDQSLDELVFVGDGEQRVGVSFVAEG
jgi:hypothetical protein